MAAYLLFVTAYWLTERDMFRIDQIKVSVESGSIDTSVVQATAESFMSRPYLWKIERDNFLLLPRSSMAATIIPLNTRIKGVVFDVESLKSLTITIDEYQPALLWCANSEEVKDGKENDECYYADIEGYVYAKAPPFSGYPFPVFRTSIAGSEESGTPIGLLVLTRGEYQSVSRFTEELKKIGILMREVVQDIEQDYVLHTESKRIILWSSKRDPVLSAEHLRASLPEITNGLKNNTSSSTSSYVDLRFEGKIFYK